VPRRPDAALAGLLATALAACSIVACASEGDRLQAGDTAETEQPGDDGDGDAGDGDTGGTGEVQGIEWSECGSADCADVEVPVDYTDPAAGTLTVSVARVPASGDRIGALFVNPGGPGGTASDFALGLAFGLPEAITDRFDLVGVDPRGLGASDIDCDGDITAMYSADPTIDSPQDTTDLLAVSQSYVDACQNAAGDLLPHLGTENVARDIAAVSEAMGDDQFSYLGYSYGTSIGQALAELFPERLRAVVLDGVVELGLTGIEAAAQQAAGFETALAAYAEDCDGDDGCPLGPDAVGAIEDLTARVEESPIPAEPRDLGPGELATGLALPLYDEDLWSTLSDAVAEALDGDGSAMVSLADDYLGLADSDIYFAVSCLDSEWPEVPEELLAGGKAAAEQSPHFGEAIVNDYVRCALWPAEEQPLVAGTAPGTPPILVVSTRNDPATPYEAGVRTAERLESGVLLSYEGEGHTIVGQGNACVDDAVVDYLVDLEPPEDGTTCEP
jgi:pimeloyl-ACP methyl ester carboxylesterase